MPVRRVVRALTLSVLSMALVNTVGIVASADDPAKQPSKQECVAANESAQDLERATRLREARAQLQVCAAKACPRAVRDDCAERLRDVDQRLPSVVFAFKDSDGSPLTTVHVTMDGTAIAERLDGTALVVDPGDHTFAFAVTGQPSIARRLVLREGEKQRRETVQRPPSPVAKRSPEGDAPAVSGDAPLVPSPVTGTGVVAGGAGERHGTLHWIAVGALGAGATGVVLGSVFGIAAAGKKSHLSDECAGQHCSSSAQGDIDSFAAYGTASTVSFVVGAVGVGVGLGLLFVFPESPKVEPAPLAHDPPMAFQVRPALGLGSVGMRGSFR